MMAKLVGRCKCGAVEYQGESTDTEGFRCYCRDCQQLTGTGHSEMMPLKAASFEVDGSYSEFRMTGGSGQPTWSGFCQNCGSQLTRRSKRIEDRIYIHAASLDDPTQYAPSKSIYIDSAQPWDKPIDA
ncbi:MAG: GFA family protein [Rhizobiaceae bacterium]